MPRTHADAVRKVMSDAGAGESGKYKDCSFSSEGIGRFRPLKGSNPTIGEIGKLEEVEEERIETICPIGKLKEVIEEIKKVHPYEEPVIDVYPLIVPE